jgi:hypothetical protein
MPAAGMPRFVPAQLQEGSQEGPPGRGEPGMVMPPFNTDLMSSIACWIGRAGLRARLRPTGTGWKAWATFCLV